MNELCQKLAEILEVDSIAESDSMDKFPSWDSLSVLSVIAMIDATYKVNLGAAEVRAAETPASLWQLIQSRKKS